MITVGINVAEDKHNCFIISSEVENPRLLITWGQNKVVLETTEHYSCNQFFTIKKSYL